MCLALRASGLWLRYATKFHPFLSLDCAPTPWRNPRKGRDQILPSGNLAPRGKRVRLAPFSASYSPSSFVVRNKCNVEVDSYSNGAVTLSRTALGVEETGELSVGIEVSII